MRRIVTNREQFHMATPWRSKPGDPTYQVPTQDLLQHRQFNPAITTPKDMHDSMYHQTWGEDGMQRSDPLNGFTSGGGSEGSQNGDSLAEAFESGQAHKLPPTEVVTNGSHALLSDGNHRAEMADTFSHPELSSYIHYDPHAYSGDQLGHPVDPKSSLGKHIDNLVQNHPYEPVDGGPTTDAVFKRHPETNRWQKGIVDHAAGAHFVDTEDYAKQMTQHVPGYKHDGLGAYFNVDWGNGPEITHERHMHARFVRTAASEWPATGAHIPDAPGAHPDDFWGGGGCGQMALAFKSMWPDLKIGADIDDKDGTVNHAWVHDGKRAHDAFGTHNSPDGPAGQWHGATTHMDMDPEHLASIYQGGVNWSKDNPWEDGTVHEAAGEIEKHWLGADPANDDEDW